MRYRSVPDMAIFFFISNGFFRIPVDHLNALHVLARYFRDKDLADTVVVSPDLGGAKEATHFARLLKLPVAAGIKRRISDEKVVIDSIVGDVDGKKVIVKELVTTDTVPFSSQSQCPPNLTTLSVAPLLGEAIRRIHHGESVSSLFTAPDWIVDTE